MRCFSNALATSVAVTLIAFAGAAHAQIPLDDRPANLQAVSQAMQFDVANAYLLQAQEGDKDAIGKAVEAFAELVKAEPTNPVLLAHLGSATSMQARTTLLPWKKINFAEDGMALQDRALAMLTPTHDGQFVNGIPMTLSTRFVAASTWLAVPGFFNRGARGERLLTEVEKSPLFGAAPLRFRGAVWLRAADHAIAQKRSADAKRYLMMVIESGAPQAQQAQRRLQDEREALDSRDGEAIEKFIATYGPQARTAYK